MNLLLDTHIFLWCVDDDPKLSDVAWSMITKAEAVYVSSASLWEIAIKHQLGKLSVEPERLAAAVSASGFKQLPVTFQHALAVPQYPALKRDPFARLLLAQAVSEPLYLLTADVELEPCSALVQLVYGEVPKIVPLR